MMKDKNDFVGALFLLLALLLAVGTAWLFPTCGPMENGAWMKCHWAGQTVLGAGVVLAVQSILYLLFRNRLVRAGIGLSAVPVAVFSIAVLHGLIGLCGNPAMQCRALTQPAATILSAAIGLLAAGNALWLLRAERAKELTGP